MNILEEIAQKTRERVAEAKASVPKSELIAQVEALIAEERSRSATEACDAAPDRAPALEELQTTDPGLAAEASDLAGAALTSSDAAGDPSDSEPSAVASPEACDQEAFAPSRFPFEEALAREGLSFICEVKRASPSKGVISHDFPYLDIARAYEEAGAAAISCLTEPYWFQGRDIYLRQIADAVSIPVLRKDFVVDDYMIYEAKLLGASAVLLICAILDDEELSSFIDTAHKLGLSALVEVHDSEELARAIKAGARIIGVNNRDLRTFTVDLSTSLRLRSQAPKELLFVSESGIRTADDIASLVRAEVDGVLVGETLMRSSDPKLTLASLSRAAREAKEGVSDKLLDEETRSGESASEGAADPASGARIKLCGMMSPEDVAVVNEIKPDYCGFIYNFPASHRSLNDEELRALSALVDPSITRVGVFVNERLATIRDLVHDGVIDAIQLHGDENALYLDRLRQLVDIPIIQAFKIEGPVDVEEALYSKADLVLLDKGTGSGESFDWDLIEGFDRPFILAGGLGPDNVEEAIDRLDPWAVDMSSGIETEKRKDPEKMRAAVAAVRRRA